MVDSTFTTLSIVHPSASAPLCQGLEPTVAKRGLPTDDVLSRGRHSNDRILFLVTQSSPHAALDSQPAAFVFLFD